MLCVLCPDWKRASFCFWVRISSVLHYTSSPLRGWSSAFRAELWPCRGSLYNAGHPKFVPRSRKTLFSDWAFVRVWLGQEGVARFWKACACAIVSVDLCKCVFYVLSSTPVFFLYWTCLCCVLCVAAVGSCAVSNSVFHWIAFVCSACVLRPCVSGVLVFSLSIVVGSCSISVHLNNLAVVVTHSSSADISSNTDKWMGV